MKVRLDQELVKSNILAITKQIGRPGIQELMRFLSKEDYFDAPSSTMFHGNYPGGLAEHSWNVTDLLFKKQELFAMCYDYDTLAICGLFHDLCKINFYKLIADDPTPPQIKYLRSLCNNKLPVVAGKLHKGYVSKLIDHLVNKTEEPPVYTIGEYKVDDQFPIGHGEKSVILLQKYIHLEPEEIMAIRFHMGAWDISEYAKKAYNKAVELSPLVTMLMTSDVEASNLLEITI